jgi:hypothetical protein
VLALEAWIARRLAGPDATEERLKGFVEIGNDHLQDVAVDFGGVRIIGLVDLDAPKLFHLANGSPLGFVDGFPLTEAIVVETTRRLQSALQALALGTGRIQTVDEGLQHSDSLLCFDVALDRLCRHVACGAGEVTPCPQGRQLVEVLVLLAKLEGSKPLALLDDARRAIAGPDANQQMDVVGLDGQFQDVPTFLAALVLDPLPAVLRHVAREDGLAALGTPDEMVDDEMDSVFIALIFHVDSIRTIDNKINRGRKEAKAQNRLTHRH